MQDIAGNSHTTTSLMCVLQMLLLAINSVVEEGEVCPEILLGV